MKVHEYTEVNSKNWEFVPAQTGTGSPDFWLEQAAMASLGVFEKTIFFVG